jgi:hypothetical protein
MVLCLPWLVRVVCIVANGLLSPTIPAAPRKLTAAHGEVLR